MQFIQSWDSHQMHIIRHGMRHSSKIFLPQMFLLWSRGRWIKYTGMGKVQWMCEKCSA